MTIDSMLEQKKLSQFNQITEKFGTPIYVYDKKIILDNFKQFQTNRNIHIHYAVKANSNLAILQLLAKAGAGFDIVSGGELMRVIKAGGDPHKIVFSGVGKQDWEITQALENNISCFNVESVFELHQIQNIAQKLNKIASISLRINPDISVITHPYITTGLKKNKFGIFHQDALEIYKIAKNLSHIKIRGIACHVGSQIFSTDVYIQSLQKLCELKKSLEIENITLSHIDIGGGFGIDYQKQFNFPALATQLRHLTDLPLWIEPGRSIVANSGVLLTRVLSVKKGQKDFVIVDCAMNDLIRPALYEAHHDIVSLNFYHTDHKKFHADIVGPICETGDFLGKDRKLYTKENDILIITMAGAYGFCMSSNYNSRPRCAEVLLDSENDKIDLIREREILEDLIAKEKCLDQI